MKRFILAAALIGLVTLAIKKRCDQERSEWHGLSETEAREKLDQRLPDKLSGDRREAVSNTIVERMRERGAIADDPEPEGDTDLDFSDQSAEVNGKAAVTTDA